MTKDAIRFIEVNSEDIKSLQKALNQFRQDMLDIQYKTDIATLALYSMLCDKLQDAIDREKHLAELRKGSRNQEIRKNLLERLGDFLCRKSRI